MNPGVGVTLVLFDVQPIGAGKKLPIEMPKIVAGHVLTMLGEVGREPEIRRAMQTRDKPFHNRSRDQLERAYARQDFRREKSSANRLSA
jgi:hypothetical protein